MNSRNETLELMLRYSEHDATLGVSWMTDCLTEEQERVVVGAVDLIARADLENTLTDWWEIY